MTSKSDHDEAATKAPLPITREPWLRAQLSRRQWWSLAAHNKTPAPLGYFGPRSPYWLLDEIDAWVLAGAPSREEWEQRGRAQARLQQTKPRFGTNGHAKV